MAIKPPELTWSSVIDLWTDINDLAADIGEKVRTVQKWKERNSVQAGKLLGIWQSAQRRGIPLSAERLLFVAAERIDHEPVAENQPEP